MSSFIYKDKDFISLIKKIAQEKSDASQSNPVPTPFTGQDAQLVETVKKLFANLKAEFGSGDKTSYISGDSGFNQVSIPNINNLENYLIFLKNKNISLSNYQIVSEQQESWRKLINVDDKNFYIYPDGLKNHIYLLFKSPDYKVNLLYREMMGRLVAQIRSKLGIDIPLPDLGDDTEVIRLQSRIDIQAAYAPGDKVLRQRDLASFPVWYQNNIDSVLENGTERYNKDNLNGICPLLQFIYKNVNDAMKDKVKNCGSRNKCPWAGAGSSQVSPSQPGGGGGGWGGPLSPTARQAQEKLIAILEQGGPFHRDHIHYGRSMEEHSDESLFSFLNNSKFYFKELAEVGDPHLRPEIAEVLREIEDCLANLNLAKGYTGNYPRVTGSVRVPNLNLMQPGQESSMKRIIMKSQAQSALDDILTKVVDIICRHFGRADLYGNQETNEELSKDIINSIFVANTRTF